MAGPLNMSLNLPPLLFAAPTPLIASSSTSSSASASPSPPSPATDDPQTPQPPRPSNAWILYRAWKIKHLPPLAPNQTRRSQSEVSSLISAMWRAETPEVKLHFERLAEVAKEDHRRKYPDYRYKPQKRNAADKGKGKGKARAKAQTRAKTAAKVNVKRKDVQSRVVSRESSNVPDFDVSSPLPQGPEPNYPSIPRPLGAFEDLVGPSPPISAFSSPSFTVVPLAQPSDFFFSAPLHSHGAGANFSSMTEPQRTEVDGNSVPQHLVPLTYTDPSGQPVPQWLADPGMSSSVSSWESSSTSVTNSNALYFDLPSEQADEWSSAFTCGHLPNEHDLTCFLSTISAPSLEEQSGEIEVSVGTVPSGSRPVDLQNMFTLEGGLPYDFDNDLFQGDDSEFNNTLLGFGPQFTPMNNYTPDQFIPSDFTTSTEAPMYIPPTGASQSSTRRVAGNWSQYLQNLDASTVQYTVPA